MDQTSNYIQIGIPLQKTNIHPSPSLLDTSNSINSPVYNNSLIAQNTPLSQQFAPQVPIVNQQVSLQQELAEVKTVLRSNPVFVVCPYCKSPAVTSSQQSTSISNLACCLCFGLLGWLSHQVYFRKDMNCQDAGHYCTRCGNKLGDYNACC